MIIKKIELHNFKSYYGPNFIEFSEGLNVISGMVGTGKTSLYDAFEWILKHNTLSPSVNKDPRLVNKKSVFEAEEGSDIRTSIVLHISYNKTLYTFEKTLRFKKEGDDSLSNSRFEVSVSYTDEETQNYEFTHKESEFKNKLNEIIPPKLLNYILFKGENVERLINFQDKETLSNAVDKVSYYPYYIELLNTTTDFEKKCSNKLTQKLKTTKRNQREVEINEYNIGVLEKNISNIKEDIEELGVLIEEKKEARDKLEIQMNAVSGIGEKFGDLERLRLERKEILQRIEDLDLKSSQKFINQWIFVKSEPLLNRFASEFSRFTKEERKQKEDINKQLAIGVPGDQLIAEMIKACNCYICGRDFEKGGKEQEVMQSHLHKNKVKGLNPEMLDLAVMFGNLNSSLSANDFKPESIINDFIDFRKKLKESEDERSAVMTKIKIAEEELDETLNERGVSLVQVKGSENFFKRWKEMGMEITRQEKILEAKKGTLQRDKNELTKARANRTKYISSEDGKKLPEDSLSEIAMYLKKSIEQLVKDERQRILQEIEGTANQMISDIIDSSKSVNNIITVKVKINLVNCKVQFTDLKGEPTIPHGAQDELAKLALISAVLSITSKYLNQDYTFIVDAPASRFDSTIYKPYFETTAKNFTQSIVVLKDIHDSLDEYRSISSISNMVLLNKNTTGKEDAAMINSFTEISQLSTKQ